MYQSYEVHGLTSNSTIKGVLDTWYQDNLEDYADKIDGNAGFCGDRATWSGSGTGTIRTIYEAYPRLYANAVPTFECASDSDLYTTSGSEDGNKALQYPIGLITADEVAYAGGVYGWTNESYYLCTGQSYWTMSPYIFDRPYGGASVFDVGANGTLSSASVNWTDGGVRPVVNLKSSVQITGGNGSSGSPYVIG